jgi:CRISPR-associated endonuclease Csn1
VLQAVQYIIPKHFTDDNALRQTKKLLRDREGRPVLKNGRKVYIQGNTVRGSLHLDTFYGCIMTPPEKGKESQQIFVQRVSCDTLTKDSADKIIDKGIRKIFIDNLNSQKQDIADIQKNGILLPYKNSNGKDVYVRKIKIKAKTTNPITLKSHNNSIKKNFKEYKQHYYVVNEENYLIALYRGKNTTGKMMGNCITLNLLEAINHKQHREPLYPSVNDTLILYKVLKVGKVVILQNSVDEDVFSLSCDRLWKRIYRVAGLSKSSNLFYAKLTHISSSKPWEYIPGAASLDQNVEFRRYQVNNFVGLVEGDDFTITPAGEIIKK